MTLISGRDPSFVDDGAPLKCWFTLHSTDDAEVLESALRPLRGELREVWDYAGYGRLPERPVTAIAYVPADTDPTLIYAAALRANAVYHPMGGAARWE